MLDETARLVKPEVLTQLLREHFGTEDEVLVTGRAQSGSSNVTAFIEFGGRRLVVRRPPSGELLPTAHDVGREYKFISSLHGSGVPVAKTILHCDDPAMIGAPFFIMERVDGYVLQNEIPGALRDPDELARLCTSAIETLARLHGVPWEGRNLPGRPTGYLQRQIARWSSQLQMTSTAGRLQGIDRLSDWVANHVPDEVETTIVHGDFGLHNMMFQRHTVAAVMDWEMATLGDPVADVTWFLEGWAPSPDGQSGNPANTVVGWPGALTKDQMYDRYTELTGRKVTNHDFYRAFNSWKGIIILEGLYATYLKGHAANASVAKFEHTVPARLAQTLREIEL